MKAPQLLADPAHTAEPDKRIATARARVALLGGVLHVVDNDGGKPVFIVSRWCLTKELDDIGAVERWLAHVERRA